MSITREPRRNLALVRGDHLIESYTLNMRQTQPGTTLIARLLADRDAYLATVRRCVERIEAHESVPNPTKRVPLDTQEAL